LGTSKQVSGIYPFNRDIFHDEEFIGAYVTNISTPLVAAAASNSKSEPLKEVDLFSRTVSIYFKGRNTFFFPRRHSTSS